MVSLGGYLRFLALYVLNCALILVLIRGETSVFSLAVPVTALSVIFGFIDGSSVAQEFGSKQAFRAFLLPGFLASCATMGYLYAFEAQLNLALALYVSFVPSVCLAISYFRNSDVASNSKS